jgi:hypothetical protein
MLGHCFGLQKTQCVCEQRCSYRTESPVPVAQSILPAKPHPNSQLHPQPAETQVQRPLQWLGDTAAHKFLCLQIAEQRAMGLLVTVLICV